jgi:chloramphenicol 3-O-phosphotransferase
MDDPASKPLRIAVVGPCSSGKSTLAKALKALGYDARHPAQEHSYVPDMWQRISKPDRLIYLDVDYTTSRQRRPYLDGGPQRLVIQRQRLAHARQHCDFYLDTSSLSPDEVYQAVLHFLER